MENEKYFENAALLEEQHRQAALDHQRRRHAAQRVPAGFDFTAPECVCGNAIPGARVALGYYNCVECQARIEKRNGR